MSKVQNIFNELLTFFLIRFDKNFERLQEAYIKENTRELVDPLDVRKKLDALEEKQNKLLKELDTQIKVSNATSMIEIA